MMTVETLGLTTDSVVSDVAVAAMPRGQRDQNGHRMIEVLKEDVQTPV
jgi:hypothetical protein